jgi:hypothetical protein
VHRIRGFIAGVISVLAAMALVGLAAPALAAAGPQTAYGQANIISTDRIVGFPQHTITANATTNPATLTVTAPAPSSPTASLNWSGYVDSGATFSAVNGSWIVPTVTCAQGEVAYSAHWIGIDGNTSSTVEQDGTEADCLPNAEGIPSPSYNAWFEMFGDAAVNLGFEEELSPSTNPVSPGDSISASVSVVGSEWTLAMTDSSSSHQGWVFSTSVAFAGAAQSSAEWVVERPELCTSFGGLGDQCSPASLADFGSVSFSDATATATGGSSGPISSYSDTAIEMVGPPNVLALPGALGADGETFTDTWEPLVTGP